MDYSLVLQNSYQEVHIGLLKKDHLITSHTISKLVASKKLVSTLHKLLADHDLIINDISHIIANQGPGPFTTLRTVLTTVNGIAYATGIPLIGINALEALYQQTYKKECKSSVVLLNAFGNDCYYGISAHQKPLTIGAASRDELQKKIAKLPAPVCIVGYSSETIKAEKPEYCSLEQVAHMGYEKSRDPKNYQKELMPLYLKNHPAQN